MASVFVELQTPLNEYSLVCRGCLAESGEMKNMQEWGLTEDFCRVADVVMESEVGISELLCTSCEDALMACKRFRTQCQQSDAALRNIAKKKTEESSQNNSQNTVSYTFDEYHLVFSVLAPDTEAKISLPCPYNCGEQYIKKKDLQIHLTKKHKRSNFKIDVKYFCFHKQCIYNEESSKQKWFDKRKALNAHYNKVHKSKIFDCGNCSLTFPTITDFNRHLKTCNVLFKCDLCDITYNQNERLMVHLMRHHPDLHKQYKNARKAEKRKSKTETDLKRIKTEVGYLSDSPKRSLATQTNVKNDVVLSWSSTKTDEISTQTMFEDLLSLKSQSEDDSILFSETVSLSDIQTQTFPAEFKQSVSNKETLTDPDIKETQCACKFDSPKLRLFDSVTSSPSNLTSTETQTIEFKRSLTDVLMNFNSAETQTCFDGLDI